MIQILTVPDVTASGVIAVTNEYLAKSDALNVNKYVTA
jgi:hypothetical protein